MVTAYKFSQKLILSAVLFAVIAILSSSISFAQCTYCTASTSYEDEYISRFVCSDIDNSTDWQSGVADYTSKSTDMKAGSDYSAKVYNPSPYSSDQVRVFIDWNKDCDFDDSGETYTLSTSDGGSTFTGTISAPMSMAGGATRMRVRMTYSSTPSACGSSSYGEVEDYTVNAILPAPDAGVAAIIPPTAPYVEGKYTVKMTLGSYGDDDVGSCT
ncbi:MAG TPA: GEVED domain-containing protein, partial [Candidatus Kapabacteria bacterium]|nr:GEVED domain-containing protein [Candidatus Kapabacteria bacterium]